MDEPITRPEVELNEDISHKLERFIRLAQLGLFQEASSWFEECLRGHEHHFCVFVEYAEMLLMQCSYSTFDTTVNKFQLESLPQCQDTNLRDLRHLLRLMKALAETRLRGITQKNLNEAVKFWDYMESNYSVDSHPGLNIFQVRAIEMYMRIVVTASWSKKVEVPARNFEMPFQLPREQGSCFGCWYKYLRTKGLHREAQKVQGIVLPLLNATKAMEGFMRKDLFATMFNRNEAENMAQSRVVVELTTSNNICAYLLEKQPHLLPLAEAYLEASKFFKEIVFRKNDFRGIERSIEFLRVNQLQEMVSQRRSNPPCNLR